MPQESRRSWLGASQTRGVPVRYHGRAEDRGSVPVRQRGVPVRYHGHGIKVQYNATREQRIVARCQSDNEASLYDIMV
ncbi:hypothetical protein J6590_099183 [Homalodisca vitripennis]|nr:hypothetical protein J6590_099183 [Homalodisca vitripennis]